MKCRIQPYPFFSAFVRSLLVSGVGIAGTFSLVGMAPLVAQQAIDSVGSEPTPAAVEPVAPATPLTSAPEPSAAAPLPPPTSPTSLPSLAEPAAPTAIAPTNEPFIDSTGYSVGATNRTVEMPTIGLTGGRLGALPSMPSSVQVGPVNISSYGLGLGTTPSIKDYYRRTLRPPGRLGNGNIQLVFPLTIPAPITSLFGWRIHPISGDARFHTGTDIGAPIGTPVVAAYAGQVALADFFGGYGLAVALNHNKDTQQTLYGHLSEIFVRQGEWVKQGAVIGRVGSTGNSTGPHLHFEFRQLTPEGWVAMDAGTQLEYSLAQLVKFMDVSEKGIASAQGLLVSHQSVAGVSGEIAWQPQSIPQPNGLQKQPVLQSKPSANSKQPSNQTVNKVTTEQRQNNAATED